MLSQSFSFIVSTANCFFLLLAGFRSFQSLQLFANRGNFNEGRLPTFPEDSDSDEENNNNTEKQPYNPIKSINSWFQYWSIFALLRFLQVFVSPQFETLLLFINVIVLSNPTLGLKLTETMYEASVAPLCTAFDNNVAPKTQSFVCFFNTSFAQAIRGVHTHFITMSIPNASEELLAELQEHNANMKFLISTEKRRRELMEFQEASNGIGIGSSSKKTDSTSKSMSSRFFAKSAKKKTTDGLRKRKGLRQSLGLW